MPVMLVRNLAPDNSHQGRSLPILSCRDVYLYRTLQPDLVLNRRAPPLLQPNLLGGGSLRLRVAGLLPNSPTDRP
jgi:hypothetical protein